MSLLCSKLFNGSPISCRIETKFLTMACKALYKLFPIWFLTSSPTVFSLIHFVPARKTSLCVFSHTKNPQTSGHFTGCFLCLEHSYISSRLTLSPPSNICSNVTFSIGLTIPFKIKSYFLVSNLHFCTLICSSIFPRVLVTYIIY